MIALLNPETRLQPLWKTGQLTEAISHRSGRQAFAVGMIRLLSFAGLLLQGRRAAGAHYGAGGEHRDPLAVN